MGEKTLKVVGLVATVLGVGASLVSGVVSEKKTENMISEKVAKEVAKQMEKK